MLRHLPYRIGTACLIFATMFVSAGSASMAPLESSPVPLLLWLEFASMDAKGDVSVDDAINPTRLSFDLSSNFRLGPKSNGINPLAEYLDIRLQYAGAVGPMYDVFVPAACFSQVGKSYVVGMQDTLKCGLSVQVETPNGMVKLLPYMENFDLRLAPRGIAPIDTPGPNANRWDLKLNIGFQDAPIAGVIAILGSPTMVKLAMGTDDDGGDGGAVTIGKIEFSGTAP